MLLDDDNSLPFQHCELVDVCTEAPIFHATKQKIKRIKGNKRHQIEQPSIKICNNDVNLPKVYYIYFEHSQDENDLLSFVTYTGPSNTLHLAKQLYLPQLSFTISGDSMINRQRFVSDYNRTCSTVQASADTSITVFIRLGIMYLIRSGIMPQQPLAIRDFVNTRNRDKHIKTSFYTSKGVSSPKNLLSAIVRDGFSRRSINAYSYDVQLFSMEKDQSTTFHFRYDEHLHCRDVLYRPAPPINFDFIRDKSSSIFRSIDDSYSDMFDFRIQLQQIRTLSKDDPNVLAVLHGVPIDEVLYIDKTDCILHVAPALRKSVKYMKCTRSSKYISADKQTTITIGAYEEFRLNAQGVCESSMKSENTMTIELLDIQTVPPAEKLYDLGMWFSSLCQTCVDLPSASIVQKTLLDRHRWFSSVRNVWKRNQIVKRINVNQLTRYTTQKSNQSYTSEELAFIKRILREESLLEVLPNVKNEKWNDQDELKKEFERVKKRLERSGVPSANEALKKVERAYLMLRENLVLSINDEQNKM